MEEEQTSQSSDHDEKSTSPASSRKSSSSRGTTSPAKSEEMTTPGRESSEAASHNGNQSEFDDITQQCSKMVSAAGNMMRGVTDRMRGVVAGIWHDAQTVRDRWQHSEQS